MPRTKAFYPAEALDRAMELFWRDGYAATGLDRLVRRTGASRYGLYTTFGGKRDLYLASLERYSQTVMDPMLEPLENTRASGREIRAFFDRLLGQIRDLEREVGVKLFERLPRGARVTRAGEQFLGNARNALESATRAVATARRTDSATGLKLAHGDLYVYTPILLKLLAAFRKASPDIPVRVVRVNDVDQHAALREHRI